MTIDESAKVILNKRYRVYPSQEPPKMRPYLDEDGNKISPLTDAMYNKLPDIYRVMDSEIGSPLYRYLQSLLEGGYADLSITAEDLLNLVDPQTCPEEFLPYYCKSMGIEYFPDLITESRGAYYIRTFLSNVGEIYKRRGTESVIKYIAKTLTEMEVSLAYVRELDDDGVTIARTMWVQILAETQEQIKNVELNAKVIKRFIDTQIPFYLTSIVSYVLTKDAEIGIYSGIVNSIHMKLSAKQVPDLPLNLFSKFVPIESDKFLCYNEDRELDWGDFNDSSDDTFTASDGEFKVLDLNGFNMFSDKFDNFLMDAKDYEFAVMLDIGFTLLCVNGEIYHYLNE